MSTPKVLILTGDAGESLEVMYPYQRLIEEGYDVQIAALSQKKLHFVVHDFEPGYDTYTEKPGFSWDADLAFKDVNPADYAAVVIPGGRAPEYIRNDRDVQRIIRHFFDQEKPVAQLWRAPRWQPMPHAMPRSRSRPACRLRCTRTARFASSNGSRDQRAPISVCRGRSRSATPLR